MLKKASFVTASSYQDDILALPVKDLDTASRWYAQSFGMTEMERIDGPEPAVVMEREGVKIGFALNGKDPSQDGAAIRVRNIQAIRDELEAAGVETANWRIDEHDGERLRVFFVIAPDGLCYYFHEPLQNEERA